jgi:hypothetical protein
LICAETAWKLSIPEGNKKASAIVKKPSHPRIYYRNGTSDFWHLYTRGIKESPAVLAVGNIPGITGTCVVVAGERKEQHKGREYTIMIMFPKRRSAKTSTTETRTTPKSSSLLPGFRSSQKFVTPRDGEEKKDCNDVEQALRPFPTTTSPTQAASPTENMNPVMMPAPVALKNERVSQSVPVDLDISVLSGDSGEDRPSPGEENVQQLLGLGLGSNQNPTGEEEDQACLLFEDEDDDQSRGQACAAAALRPPALRVSSPQELAYHVPDDLDHVSVQRPPSEIDLDFDAVPPSPMRDPSVASGLAGGAPLLPQHPLLGFPSEVEVDFAPEFGLRTKLCDAERLVRVILGSQAVIDGKFSSLEHGSILQAIRTFAVMKQELIELRQKAERKDGDPPAILTNLTSPGTTNHTHSFSSPGTSSPQSPETPEDDDSYQRHRQALRTTRNALVNAAKKCHSLEEQLKRANETIDRLQLEQTPNPYILSLEQNLPTTTCISSTTNKTSAELEDILAKLHNVPAASVSRDDREKIRQYVLDMVASTKCANHEQALQQSQQREANVRRQLQAAEERIQSLEQQLQRFQSNEIPDPLDQANRQLQMKDERIAQLEASQARLQSLVQLAVTRSQPLQEKNHSERFRKLEAEYQTLAESVHFLEGQTVSL